MPTLKFVTLDVFTKKRFAGNPLAVVRIPNGQEVSTEQMQTIAREFNLSETVFIYENAGTGSDGRPEWRIRIFMTEAELPFAGHPTIGAACYAFGTLLRGSAKGGRLLCNAGPIEVDYDSGNGGRAKAAIPHNVHIHSEKKFTVEEVYQLQPALKQRQQAVKNVDVVSPVKGMNFICVQLGSLEDLAVVETSGVKPRAQLDAEWDVGFTGSYFYVVESSGDGALRLRTRMIEGTLEDPATGSAACGLSALLALRGGGSESRRWTMELMQGVEMGRESNIQVDVMLREGRAEIETIELGGSAVKVMEGEIEYD